MDRLPDLSPLSHDEKDALIHALWAQVQVLTAHVGSLTTQVAELEAKLGLPERRTTPAYRRRGVRSRTATTSLPAVVRVRAASDARVAGGGVRGTGRDRHRPVVPLRAVCGTVG